MTVFWTDAATSDPWQPAAGVGLVEVATTGYIVEQTAEYIKLASSVSAEEDTVSNITCIPCGMIRRIERLKRR